MDLVKKTGDTIHAEMPIYLTDFHFLDQYHIPVIAGRALSAAFSPDRVESMIINETALHRLGFRSAEEAIGVKVGMYPNDGRVVGVFRDFHFESLQKAIEPLAIGIACFGLFGLVTYSVRLRTKEIGIRKVVGASVPQIVVLLSRDFFRLIAIAVFIATPVAFFVMNKWITSFAYRIDLSAWIFPGAGAVALLIGLATISHQAIRAAVANPVDSLRSE